MECLDPRKDTRPSLHHSTFVARTPPYFALPVRAPPRMTAPLFEAEISGVSGGGKSFAQRDHPSVLCRLFPCLVPDPCPDLCLPIG